MPKLSDIKLGGKINALFIGKSGSRKTSAAASFPGPIYYFDFDGRMEPLALHYSDRTDIEFDTYGVNDIGRAMAKMKSLSSYNPFRTIVFDSFTAIGDSSIFGSRNSRDEGKNRLGVKMPDPDDYNLESAFMHNILSFMKDVKCHVIITAHILKIEENDVDSKIIGKKKVTYGIVTAAKKVSAKLPGYFNEVYHFYTESGFNDTDPTICKVATDQDGEIAAKTALPLPKYIDWTGKRFYDVLEGYLKQHKINSEVEQPRDPLPESNDF